MRSSRVRPARTLAAAVAAVLASAGLLAAPAAAAGPPPLHASPTPLLWPRSGLETVSATGPNDVWAAGYQGYQGIDWSIPMLGAGTIDVLPPKAVVTRWNGMFWQNYDIPGTGGDAVVTDIDAGSPTNVWAVGALHAFQDIMKHEPFVARWDGSRWHNVPLPGGCAPLDPEADATGAWLSCGKTVLRWQDGEWTRYDAGGHDGCCIGVTEISALPGGPAWAATTWGLVRWDGRAWSEIAELPQDVHWYRVTAVSDDEVWAAGTAPGGSGYRERVLYRWDGESWSEGPATPADGELIRTGDGTMWAVEGYWGGVHRFDGDAWTEVEVPVPDDGQITAATNVPGSPALWAVGKTRNVPVVLDNG
ncbi:hypothetical protein [Actinomadura sp. WAC 06369]|uniref:hypothetical protein n=1 Tax=Actinomadura sp. WAC 06369 TaxID=2203193 RepID=UPI000F76D6B3|nr:hypothetical protein [Actinomadura sp. WAC 06369]RSN68089.1 hypothetical protein DMH08_11795 [Actinomadura sp. WAC 06369]